LEEGGAQHDLDFGEQLELDGFPSLEREFAFFTIMSDGRKPATPAL
jgi:hypothetical protein